LRSQTAVGDLRLQVLANASEQLSTGQKGVLCGVVFQLLWFICIFCPIYIVVMSAIGYLVLYLSFISRDKRDLAFALGLACIGYLIDTAWLKVGLFEMPGALPPLWLAILWFLFSLSLAHAFYFLRCRYLLCAIVGGLGGAFSYLSAIALRPDVDFGFSIITVFVSILILWSVLFPAAFYIWERVCGTDAVAD